MRTILFPPPSEVVIRGQRVALTGQTITVGRLQDQIFGRDMAALEAAEEIRIGVSQMEERQELRLSDVAWRMLVQATVKPTTALYIPGSAPFILPYLRAIRDAREDEGDG